MDYGLDEVIGRHTGRTTRIAINLIDAMLKEPGKQFEVIDHTNTRHGDKYLADLICRTLGCLGIRANILQTSRNDRIFLSINPLRRFL